MVGGQRSCARPSASPSGVLTAASASAKAPRTKAAGTASPVATVGRFINADVEFITCLSRDGRSSSCLGGWCVSSPAWNPAQGRCGSVL